MPPGQCIVLRRLSAVERNSRDEELRGGGRSPVRTGLPTEMGKIMGKNAPITLGANRSTENPCDTGTFDNFLLEKKWENQFGKMGSAAK
jgi:hypothetical protein